MAERARDVTVHLSEDVLTAMEHAIGQGAAADASAFIERALVRALPDMRRKSRRAAWEEASRDPLFLGDVAEVDPVRGSEQRDRRPVLIVSNEDFNVAAPNVTVLPLTSTQRRLYPSEVWLPSGAAGQPVDSIVMAHQVRTISKQRLGNVIDALREHFDLD
jgi:mRNA interferase MazF